MPALAAALQAHAAGHDVEREQQHDERHVFDQHRMDEFEKRDIGAERRRARREEGERAGERVFSVVTVPEIGGQQRTECYPRQHRRERQQPGRSECRTVDMRRASFGGQGGARCERQGEQGGGGRKEHRGGLADGSGESGAQG
jgi:hypothetical protein